MKPKQHSNNNNQKEKNISKIFNNYNNKISICYLFLFFINIIIFIIQFVYSLLYRLKVLKKRKNNKA